MRFSNWQSHFTLGKSPPQNLVVWVTDSGFVRFLYVYDTKYFKIDYSCFFFKPFSVIHITILPFDTYNLSSCKSILSNPKVNTHTQDFLMQNDCGFQLLIFVPVKGTLLLCLLGLDMLNDWTFCRAT